jgi:hypothetical protein
MYRRFRFDAAHGWRSLEPRLIPSALVAAPVTHADDPLPNPDPDPSPLPPEPEPTDPFPGLPPSGPAGPGTTSAVVSA